MISDETLSPSEIKLYTDENLVAKYRLFQSHTQAPTDLVYYPCSGQDTSPSAAFPNSRVVYAEINVKVVNALKTGGFEAQAVSAEEFNPGNVNVLILLNPSIKPDFPASTVVSGGYVVCNDYHSTATLLKENTAFILKGIIRKNAEGEIFFDEEAPDDYWEPIETEEEWKTKPLSYERAAYIVEQVTGKREDVFHSYARLLNEARERNKKQTEEMLQKHPEWAGMMGTATSEQEPVMYSFRDQQFLLSPLPPKKGSRDDMFIFQKK